MTDNKIIKALECCIDCDCKNCPCQTEDGYCMEIDEALILNLINRQNTEIEKLKIQNAKLEKYFTVKIDDEKLEELFEQAANNIEINIKKVKSEAIREFAERLKETPLRFRISHKTHWNEPPKEKMVLFIDDKDIDNLVKEMTED